jgi:hypothetical protein
MIFHKALELLKKDVRTLIGAAAGNPNALR